MVGARPQSWSGGQGGVDQRFGRGVGAGWQFERRGRVGLGFKRMARVPEAPRP